MATTNQAQADADTARRTRENDKASQLAEQESQIQYTLFASGLINGGRANLLDEKNNKDDVAILFDVVTDTTYTKTFQKSNFPLESKANASDHVQALDGKFSFTARISDVITFINPKNYLDRDTDPDNPMQSKRSTKGLEILEKIASERNMLTLVTEDNILTGYVITSLSVARTAQDGSSLAFQIELEEFRRVAIGRTVLATTPPKKATKKAGGAKQTAKGGDADNDAQGKRNNSPYISKSKKDFAAVDEYFTGKKYEIVDEPAKTIRPDGKFDPHSLKRQ